MVYCILETLNKCNNVTKTFLLNQAIKTLGGMHKTYKLNLQHILSCKINMQLLPFLPTALGL